MNAQALNPQQTKLRDDIQNWLIDEGFRAEIDSDGDIKFKRGMNLNTKIVTVNKGKFETVDGCPAK